MLIPIIRDDIPEDNEFFIVSIVGDSGRIDVNIQFDNATIIIRGIMSHSKCLIYT